ncbi:hypothetical protein CALCODRAFT_515884 [Calocera cornea HHB12733]|uniref:Nucleolus and neural progenitor protein-like N-terminal domain-containing protein n=1 Tax=Calocera cornea HHB12733 TaxID=1353952 RepID=A0A165HV08_9BASI|nr:hypothetical protein CALCODRAFT_515884 [Calocera cornea HHB12733]
MAALNPDSHERGTLPPELISLIDLELKNFRTTSRAVHALSSVLDAEFKLLDRVYYKGNSQHRSGLFWKRAAEIRRLARRVHDIRLEGLIDEFRESFFADPKNIKRAPWTKVPGQRRIHDTLQRLSSVSHLFAHGIDRCHAAYSWFVRQLQSTAFFPLAMTLIAIVARLHIVFCSLSEELLKTWEAIDRLYQQLPLKLGATQKVPPRISRTLRALLGAETALPRIPSSSKLAAVAKETGDDLGQTISRVALPTPKVSMPVEAAGSQSFPPSDTFTLLELEEDDVPMDVVREDMVEDASEVVKQLEEHQLHSPQTMPSGEQIDTVPELLRADEAMPTPPPATPARKKKKKPRVGGDEIDAIFGF